VSSLICAPGDIFYLATAPLIRTCIGEGRERADRRCVKLGRKPQLTPEQRRERRLAASCRTAEPIRHPVIDLNPELPFMGSLV
jgi:hypothetical protein